MIHFTITAITDLILEFEIGVRTCFQLDFAFCSLSIDFCRDNAVNINSISRKLAYRCFYPYTGSVFRHKLHCKDRKNYIESK